MTAIILTLALLLQQPASMPPQRPPEITISIEEYARLKTCEAQQIENQKLKQKSKRAALIAAIAAGAAVAVAAIIKRK